MNKKQCNFWLDEEIWITLKEFIPPRKLSPLFRDFALALISDAPVPAGLSADSSEIILKVKAEIEVNRKEKEKQDFIKSELFKFLSNKRIPVIYARSNKERAKKLCFEFIPAFREDGYLLPECYVKPYINEYLRKIEANGEILNQYKEVQETIKQEC